MRLHNLSKWAQLAPTEALRLPASDTRQVRIDVNCTEPTRIDARVGEQGTFIAIVEGLETIEFTIEGDAELMFTTDGEVWYFTNEGGDQPFEIPDAIPFVGIMNRRARNEVLEQMMFRAEQNMNRRLAHLDAEYADLKARLGYDPNTGEENEPAENSAVDPSGNDGEKPIEPPAAEPSGTGTASGTGTGTSVPTGSTPAK